MALRFKTITAELKYTYRARYWVRTSDLFRVKEARYHCANRANYLAVFCDEVATGFEPVYTALQAAASPLGHATVLWLIPQVAKFPWPPERMTRLELATLTLAR